MPGRSCTQAAGSSSSSCRAGRRARARPSARRPSRSRRCSASGSSAARHAGETRELRSWSSHSSSSERRRQSLQSVFRCSAISKPCSGSLRLAPVIVAAGNSYDVARTHCQSATEQPAGLALLEALELPMVPRVAVVVAGHHDGGLLAARQIPEARQRRAVEVHLGDQVREQALLLVGLRDRGPCSSRASRGKKRSSDADRVDLAVALLPGPGGLPCRVATTERARS